MKRKLELAMIALGALVIGAIVWAAKAGSSLPAPPPPGSHPDVSFTPPPPPGSLLHQRQMNQQMNSGEQPSLTYETGPDGKRHAVGTGHMRPSPARK